MGTREGRHLGQEDDAGHMAAAGLDGAVHERGQAGGERGGDGACGLHGGHARLGLAVRQPRARQAQRPLVHRLLDQAHVDRLRVLAHLRAARPHVPLDPSGVICSNAGAKGYV